MPAIRQNLFAQFALDDVETASVAALGLGTVEVQARVHECLGICKQMIAQDVILQAVRKPTSLNRQAGVTLWRQGIAAGGPLYPVHDPAR